MSAFTLWIVLMTLQVLTGSPTGIKKRAHNTPPKHSNSTGSRAGQQHTIAQSVNISTTVNGTKDICPSHLIPHNLSDVTVCCVPYFNCPVGYGIKVCENDEEKDQCIPCPPFMVQKNNVSSLNMEEAECYSEENTENCPLDDTKPSWKMKSLICLINCECKNEECFYGKDPCACELRSPCPINYTMNRDTGACERCPQFAYKDYVGCGTCTVIPELWAQRHSLPTTPEPSHQSSSVKESNLINDDTDGLKKETKIKTVVTTDRAHVLDKPDTDTLPFPTWAIVVVLFLIGIAIGIGTIAIILLIVMKRKHSGSFTHLPLIGQNANNYNANPGQRLRDKRDRDNGTITELQDGFEMGINLQRANPVHGGLKLAKKDERRDDVLGAVGGAEPITLREEKKVEEATVNDSEDRLFGMENKKEASHKQTHVSPKPNMGQCMHSELEPLLNELHVVIPNDDSFLSSGLSDVESLETNLKTIYTDDEYEQHVPCRSDVIHKKPMAVIVPFRHTSVQEPTMETVHNSNNSSNRQEPDMIVFQNPDQLESNVEPYMYSVPSDSYAVMHMNGQTDVADLDNLVLLNASTIGADDSVSRHDQINAEQYGGVPCMSNQNHRNVTEPDESISTNNLETHNIFQPNVTETIADSFVLRPDLQKTGKTVEETDVEENSVTQLNEETFAEAPVSFPSHDTENMNMTCNGDITDGCGENLDEIGKEKLNNASTVTGVVQDNEAVIEISEETRVNNDKENEVEKSNNIAETIDSQNVEAEQTDTGSRELPIDCLENNSLHASNTEQLNSDAMNSVIAQTRGLDTDECVGIICNNLNENNDES